MTKLISSKREYVICKSYLIDDSILYKTRDSKFTKEFTESRRYSTIDKAIASFYATISFIGNVNHKQHEFYILEVTNTIKTINLNVEVNIDQNDQY